MAEAGVENSPALQYGCAPGTKASFPLHEAWIPLYEVLGFQVKDFNWKLYHVTLQSHYCFFFFFSIANILPIAPGKYNIPVNVLKSISKQILIKALRTEA